ncbi:MAG: hypothetical protein ACR2ML_00715 [Solirubrobacteraceae bacterium]
MAEQSPQRLPTATELVRAMRERNAPRRERVLASIDRLRQIAEAKRAAARR